MKVLFSNRLFIGTLVICVLIVVCGILYLQHIERQSAHEFAEMQKRVKVLTEKPNAKPTAKVSVRDTLQGGHSEVPTKQVPYHPHDDLSPEEHQRVHAELKRYQSKLDDLNRRLEENNAALRARRITADESLTFLDSAGQELASIKANIKRLQGE